MRTLPEEDSTRLVSCVTSAAIPNRRCPYFAPTETKLASRLAGVALDRCQDTSLGQQLGEDIGRAGSSCGIDHVGRHAGAAQRGQLPGDLRVLIGPVGFEQGYVVRLQCGFDVSG